MLVSADEHAPLWALDVGLKKTGVARCVAGVPLPGGLLKGGRDAQWRGFLALVAAHGLPREVALGWPLKTGGEANPQQHRVDWWAHRLSRLGITVTAVGERHTSQEARRRLSQTRGHTGLSEDELAAVVILEDFLSRQNTPYQ